MLQKDPLLALICHIISVFCYIRMEQNLMVQVVNNFIVRSKRDVIVVANIIARRTSKA